MGDVAPSLARALEQSLAAGAGLARGRQPLLHLAQRLVAGFALGLGEGKIVGSLAPLALGVGDGV